MATPQTLTPASTIMRATLPSMRPIHRLPYNQILRATSFHKQSIPPPPLPTSLTLSHHRPPRAKPTIIPSHRSFTASPATHKDHHFDTLKLTQHLERAGLSREQSESLMKVLASVLEESIQNLTRSMVPREDALKTAYTQKIDFNALRTELLQSDTAEATLTKTTHDRLQNEVVKLGQRLRDEVERTKSGVKLDLNLEKGRTKDEREAMEMRIRETETRIEQEVAGLRERVEGVKFDTVRWLAGVVTGTMALLLGAWRLFM